MSNLTIYNEVREVPQEAQKTIKGGRLSGYTDINPMWRIETLTEQFGPCGVGWKYEIADKRLEQGANGEIAAFVDINLYFKVGGEWSEPVPGTGGSMFVAKEKNGMYTSDECYKMALTDAISVACKALGVGADVYWSADTTKYDRQSQTDTKTAESSGTKNTGMATKTMIDEVTAIAMSKYGQKEPYWDRLKELADDGKISSQFPYTKDKKVQWTTDDIEHIKADLELPF